MPPVGRVNGWAKGGKEVLGSSKAPAKPAQQTATRPLIDAKLFVRTTTEFQFRTSPDLAAKNEKGVYAKVGEKFGVKRHQDGWCQLDNELWLPIQVGDELLLLEGIEHNWYQVLVSPGVSYRASRRVEDKYGDGKMFAKKGEVVGVRRVAGAWCYLTNGLFLPLSIKGTWLLKKLVAPVASPRAEAPITPEASKPAAPTFKTTLASQASSLAAPAGASQPPQPANSEATGKTPSLPSPAATPTKAAKPSTLTASPSPEKDSWEAEVDGESPDPEERKIARTIKVSGCSRTKLNGIYELEPSKLYQNRNVWLQMSLAKNAGEKTKLIRWQESVKEWVIDDELSDSTSVYACPSRSEDVRDPTEVQDGWAVYKSKTGEFVLEEAMKVMAVPQDDPEVMELKPPVAAAIPTLPGQPAREEPKKVGAKTEPTVKKAVPWYLKCDRRIAKVDKVDDAVYSTLVVAEAPKANSVSARWSTAATQGLTDSSDEDEEPAKAEPESGAKKPEPKDPAFHKKMLEYLKIQEKKKEEDDKAPSQPEEPRPKPTPQSLLDLPSAPYVPTPPLAKGNMANMPNIVPPVVPNASLFSTDGSIPGTRGFGVNGYGRAIGPMAPVIPQTQRGRPGGRKRGGRIGPGLHNVFWNGRNRGRGNSRRGRGRGNNMRFNVGRGGRGRSFAKFVPGASNVNGLMNPMMANTFKPNAMPTLPPFSRSRQPLVPTEPLGLVVYDNQLCQAKGVLGHSELVCVSVHTTGRLRDKFLPRGEVRFMRPQQKAKPATTENSEEKTNDAAPAPVASKRKLDVGAKEFKPTG